MNNKANFILNYENPAKATLYVIQTYIESS